MKTLPLKKVFPFFCFCLLSLSGPLWGIETRTPVLTMEEAKRTLIEGNKRFVEGKMLNPDRTIAVVKQLKDNQSPHSVVISCSDSRVPTEVIFDQGLGDIFVIRSAGNVLDPKLIASVEFAVKVLGVSNIVVLGHTNCGAVKVALETPYDGKTFSPYVDVLVHDIQQRLLPLPQKPSPYLRHECGQNVKGVVKELLRSSKIVRDAKASDDVNIMAGLYNTHSGVVDFFEEEKEEG